MVYKVTKEKVRKMTKQEKEEWDALYEYVRTRVMGYDGKQKLEPYIVLRLKGLAEGKAIANRKTKATACYSYLLILNTFKYSMPDIRRAVSRIVFNDTRGKFNYIMRIVENNINTVYIRMKNAEKAKVEAQESDVSYAANYVNMFKAKKTNSTKKLDDLW